MSTITPGLYRHFKGHDVRVICVATHTETGEIVVVYEHLGPNDTSRYWVRPVTMFSEQVVRDGYTGPRFTRIEL